MLLLAGLLTPWEARAASVSTNFAVGVTAAQAIGSVTLSSSTIAGGVASGTVVGAIGVTMSPTSPAFSRTLSLTGANAANFLVGSNLLTNGTLLARTYKVDVVASEAGTTGSPSTQPETITTTSYDPSACPAQTYTYNLGTDFGAVSGGPAATNDTALQAFNVEAQRRTRPAEPGYAGGANGAGNAYPDASKDNCIVLNIPAGTYQYTFNTFATKIGHLRIVGAGSSATNLQDVYAGGGAVYGEEPYLSNDDYFQVPYGPSPGSYGYLMNTANAGDTQVTLAGNASNASQFYVGRWVLIWSYEQQYSGLPSGSSSYPPNARYYDYARVTSVNLSTGVITLDTPLAFQHRSDRPYAGTLTDGPTGTWGPARITPIDTPASPVAMYQEVDGVHFLSNPNWNIAGATQLTAGCVQFAGIIDGAANDVLGDNCFAFSQLRDFTISNSTWVFDEADKLVRTLTYNNDTVGSASVSGSGTYNHAGELMWHVIGGHITNYRASCCGPGMDIGARTVVLEGGLLLDGMSVPGGNFHHGIMLDDNWQTVDVTANGVTFVGDGNTNNAPVNAPSINYISVDGTVVSVATGPNGPNTRLQMQKNLAAYGSPSEIVNDNWGDGAPIWKNGGWVSGATLSSTTGDANYVYVDIIGTTFAPGDKVWAAKVGSLTVENCVGRNTGYSWGSPNLRYPNGANSVPNIIWSNNSGN
jgi:hypothetical protein